MPDKTPTKSSREKIEEVMAEKEDMLHPEDSVQTAGDKMRALDSNMLPVSEGRRLVGMADETDPDRRAAAHGHDPHTTRISESMNRQIVYCHEDEECAEALRKMNERQLSHLPVVDHEMRIIGLVSREDLTARVGQATADQTDAGKVGQ